MEYIVNHGNVKKLFAGSNFKFGYYAFVDSNGQFVIGEERGREGGELFRGEYKDEKTPWLNDIKKENVRLYNSITKYFNENANNENANMNKFYIKDANDFREAIIGIANYMAFYNKEVCAFSEPIKVEWGLEGTKNYEGTRLVIPTIALVNRTKY